MIFCVRFQVTSRFKEVVEESFAVVRQVIFCSATEMRFTVMDLFYGYYHSSKLSLELHLQHFLRKW
jgi:hypothetical protein